LDKKLHKAVSSIDYVTNPYNLTNFYGQPFIGDVPWGAVPGTVPIATSKMSSAYGRLNNNPTNYGEELFQCRFFYRFDPTASTVLNRMAELSAATVRNRRDECTDEEFFYFDALSERITELLNTCALEYLVSGLVIPDYGTTRVMGNKLNTNLGRKRYTVPEHMWVRNPENIVLKRVPFGPERRVYLRKPPEEWSFINNEGIYADGTEDRELYQILVRDFPEYVRAIRDGKSQILLEHVRPILRKIMPNCEYPQPFLVPALAALKHKLRIKEMDHSIATKALEAILHIKAGNDEYPVTDEDTTLSDLQAQMSARSTNAADQLLYKLYTDHTVEIKYIYPELQALLTPQKYEAVDADIFMAMGFSRVLLVGESAKSNAGAGPQIILGPLSMLEELRERLLVWVRGLYKELADMNNFTHTPEPFFDPLVASDVSTLLANASTALQAGVISKNTYASMFGTNFETEQRQIELEVDIVANSPVLDQQVQLNQQKHTPPPVEQQGQTSPDGVAQPAPKPQLPSDILKG
jgi:hypothetical protein